MIYLTYSFIGTYLTYLFIGSTWNPHLLVNSCLVNLKSTPFTLVFSFSPGCLLSSLLYNDCIFNLEGDIRMAAHPN
jgi:hypothetical protein